MNAQPAMKIDQPTPNDATLVVRPARASDRDAIIEMSKHIWGGLDYLPLVWDRWLEDPNGGLLTVELDGEPVGVSKVTLLSPGEVWLEGLRLHPKLHGRGLTKQINRVSFRKAMEHNPKSIRYATGVGNAASRHLGEFRGFWLVASTHWIWGRAIRGENLDGRIASTEELDAVLEYIGGTDCYRDAGGLLAVDWKFLELKRERVRDLIGAGRVLILPRRGKIRAAAIYSTGSIDDNICLGFINGSDDEIRSLARDVLRITGRSGLKEASAMLPIGRLSDLVFEAGY
ncbi:GNAT family N-acetyltransferase, partial [bacterium]|nr:GNAT family N-acetyltransferase [bacterium]